MEGRTLAGQCHTLIHVQRHKHTAIRASHTLEQPLYMYGNNFLITAPTQIMTTLLQAKNQMFQFNSVLSHIILSKLMVECNKKLYRLTLTGGAIASVALLTVALVAIIMQVTGVEVVGQVSTVSIQVTVLQPLSTLIYMVCNIHGHGQESTLARMT